MAARRRVHRERRRLRRSLLALLAVWAAGFALFLGVVPAPGRPPETAADAIVVLTGGSGRLEAGLRLLAEGHGAKLFVSGVNARVDAEALLREQPRETRPSEAARACCIILGHSASNTAGNARESAAWMEAEGFGSLILVTSTYHMPRSLLEFRRLLPGMRIVAYAVAPASGGEAGPRAALSQMRLLFSEYHKYLFALLRDLVSAP